MGFFSRLFGSKQQSGSLRSFLCSTCYEVHAGEEMCVLPWWNADAESFFMSNRCPECFKKSLAETEDRLNDWDAAAAEGIQSFIGIWNIFERFPELEGNSDEESARKIVHLVKESAGKVFVPLAQGG